jgi:predicted lipase
MDKVVEVHAWRHDAHGFVGHDNTTGAIVAAFTGTDPLSIPDWVDDLDFVKTTYPFCSFSKKGGATGRRGATAALDVIDVGCRVHRGFLESYMQIRDQVLEALVGLLQAHPDAPLLLTGHSLGAALATFAVLDVLHVLNDSVSALYTFGKPRIGNRPFQVRARVCLSVCLSVCRWMGG